MDKKVLELETEFDITLTSKLISTPSFLDKNHILFMISRDNYRIVDIRTNRALFGLQDHIDVKTPGKKTTITNINNLYASKEDFRGYDLYFFDDVPDQADMSHYILFMQNEKLYLMTIHKTVVPKKISANLKMFSIESPFVKLMKVNEFFPGDDAVVDYEGNNSLTFDHVRISKKMYGIFRFTSKKRREYYIIDYDKFMITNVIGSHHLIASDYFNSCSCHPYFAGYAKHMGVFPIVGKSSVYLYEFSKNRVHEIPVTPDADGESPDIICTYSRVINKYLLILPQRILILPDLTDDVSSKRKSELTFHLERKTDELILEATTRDNLRTYRSIMTYNLVNTDPFITSFNMLSDIVYDAVNNLKENVTMTHQINETTKNLDISIEIDVVYRKFHIDFVMFCIKSPYDPETEIKKLKDVLENFTKNPVPMEVVLGLRDRVHHSLDSSD